MMREGDHNGLHPAHGVAERMSVDEIYEAGVLAEAPAFAVMLVNSGTGRRPT
ncbi:MAG TPA: hypothetical protein VF062_21555 [Candidatus Limnocylindrales bacterium]